MDEETNTIAENQKYDAVIIGCGPGGYSAAIRIAQLGGKVCIIEKGNLGGTCANSGCIPVKTLVSITNKISDLKKMDQLGINLENCSYDWEKIKQHVQKTVQKSVQGMRTVLASNNIEIITGSASISQPGEVIVRDQDQIHLLETKNVVIATGSKPSLPEFVPEDSNIITNEDILNLKKVPSELVIVGGSRVGLEFANIFHSLGTKVCVLEILPQLLPQEDQEVIAELHRILARKGIQIITNVKIEGVTQDKEKLSVGITHQDQYTTIKTDQILLAAGRKANFDREELQKLGIVFNEQGIVTDDCLKTNVPSIYAVGDINGTFPAAHIASAEGLIAAENIMGNETKISYQNVPCCLFTNPEVASIGEKTATFGKYSFLANGKARTMNETAGFVKVYLQNNLLVGASIIGPHASDLIAVVQGLLGKHKEKIKQLIFAHPTLPEAIVEAVRNSEKNEESYLRR